MFMIVAGDLDPDMPLAITLNGAEVDLSTATSVELQWYKPDGTSTTVSLTAVNSTLGQYKRVWASGDTDVVGYHRGRVVVTWASTEKQTYPNDGSWLYWHVHRTSP